MNKKILIGIITVVVVIGVYLFLAGGPKPTIKIDNEDWDSIKLNTAIAKFIVSEGYEYQVKIVEETSKEVMENLSKGVVDLTLEGWQQNKLKWYNENIEKGTIVNLGMTFESGPQFFIIPKWFADQYNIRTIFDMASYWRLFKDPEDSTKGVFYNCLIGWACKDINIVKMEAYGLTRQYNMVSSASEEALESVMAKAQQNRQPVFGYFWAPTALMGKYDWYILEEPSYSDKCWEKVVAAVEDKSLRPIDEACAYESLPVDKIAHVGLAKKAPDVVEMLKKMNVGLEPLNQVLAWAEEENIQDWEEAAIYYLQNYEERWETWVTPQAYGNIKRAIE